MGTAQQLLLHGDAGADFGDLVVELLFEDGNGSTTAANTGTLAGTYSCGGPTGASVTTADAFSGSGCLGNFSNVSNAQGGASDGHPPQLIIGTANFRIEVAVKLATFTTTFGQVFWGWEFGAPSPALSVDTSGNLIVGYAGTSADTGVDVTTNVWHTYEMNRVAGVTNVLYDGTQVWSIADTSNYNNGFTSGSFRVGCAGNLAGGIRGSGVLDQFRFYNGNA